MPNSLEQLSFKLKCKEDLILAYDSFKKVLEVLKKEQGEDFSYDIDINYDDNVLEVNTNSKISLNDCTSLGTRYN